MKKTPGSILRDLLLAIEKGASKEKLEKMRLELEKESKKQLHGAKVTVAVEIRQ